MDNLYKKWESQFLDDMVIKFGFSGNDEIAFKQRLLSSNSDLKNTKLVEELASHFRVKGKPADDPYSVFRDCWHKPKRIYETLRNEGFNYKDKENPNGHYEKSWEDVRKWLIFEVFPKYLKTISPRTSIEIWQELWTKAEAAENNIIITAQENDTTIQLEDLGIGVAGVWRDNRNDYPSFSIGSKIQYQFNLNGYQYLILIQKFASGEFYCLAPSQLSPSFPVDDNRVILPHNNVFTVQPPTGMEEIIAVFSHDKPEISWLPKSTEPPLELKEERLADILNYVNDNNCFIVGSKYLITD